MTDDILSLYLKDNPFSLDERFSYPIREYYYNLKSLIKYWFLTKNLIINTIHKNSLYDEVNSNITEEPDFIITDRESNDSNMMIDGDEVEHDKDVLPKIQRNLILCNGIVIVERLLKDVCEELDENYVLNGKGSIVQQYYNFITKRTSIVISKKNLKNIEVFSHIRNAYMHQFNSKSVPLTSIQYINKICGNFTDIKSEVSNVHVDMLMKVLCEFGKDFQLSYWQDYEKKV